MTTPVPPTPDAPAPATPAGPGGGAAPNPSATRSAAATLLILGLTFLILWVGWTMAPGWNFLVVLALLAVSLFVLGMTVVGRPLGVLINEQNLASLARFQMVVWTVVVLAAYFTYALARMKAGTADPLNVTIDWHLWALMGMSTTSLVGTSLIHTVKQGQEPDPAVTASTAAKFGQSFAAVESDRAGLLYANPGKNDARFTDLFQGDEVGDTAHIDMVKVQMFYFTIISVLAFVVMVTQSLRQGPLDEMPRLPDGLIAILGISHAGYLTGKSVTKTPLQQPNS